MVNIILFTLKRNYIIYCIYTYIELPCCFLIFIFHKYSVRFLFTNSRFLQNDYIRIEPVLCINYSDIIIMIIFSSTIIHNDTINI